MNNRNVKRLLHTVLPFMILNLIQRSLLLLFGTLELSFLSNNVISLIAFLAACAVAVLAFRQKTYTVDEETEVLPLTKESVGFSLMHAVFSCASMVVVMYAVSLTTGASDESVLDMSVLSLTSTLIIHPIVEEYVFRKMFYGELRLMNPIFGCIAQALMFAILHATVDGMIYALISGVLLCLLYEHTGRLWVCIAAHIFINLRSVLCLTVLRDMPNLIHGLDFALVIAGILCFFGCAAITNRPKKMPAEDDLNE